jgi:hypothetical protein
MYFWTWIIRSLAQPLLLFIIKHSEKQAKLWGFHIDKFEERHKPVIIQDLNNFHQYAVMSWTVRWRFWSWWIFIVTQIFQQVQLSSVQNSLRTSTSVCSCSLAPSQSMCYSAFKDSTPQLTTTVCDNLPQRTQYRNVQWPIYSTLNRTTRAPMIVCVLHLSRKTCYPGNHEQSVPLLCNNANNHP